MHDASLDDVKCKEHDEVCSSPVGGGPCFGGPGGG